MSDFEDELLKDFGGSDDDGGGDDDDGNNSSEGDDAAMDLEDGADEEEVELSQGSDVPKVPLRENAEYRKFLGLLAEPEELLKDVRVEDVLERCNETMAQITGEIGVWHRRAIRLYQPAFPELSKLVPDPVDFARVVLEYGETDEAELANVLDSATIMVVKVSKSAHIHSVASMEDKTPVKEALRACQNILELDKDRTAFLAFVEAQMKGFAPNLYDLVGSRCAALLIGTAGGLGPLGKIPSNDIQVMGRRKAARADTGIVHGENAQLTRHGGILMSCPLIAETPPSSRRKVLRVLAGRVALAARVDENKRGLDSGKIWRAEIEKKIDQWLQPGPGQMKKALPIPDAVKPKRRGGRRARKMKEKLGLTTMRALANREQFGQGSDDVDYSASAMGLDVGMLGKSLNSGRVRSTQVRDTQKLGQHAQKKLRSINAGGSRHKAVSGFSSLAFTPVQGMELAPSTTPGMTTERASGAKKKSAPPVPSFTKS